MNKREKKISYYLVYNNYNDNTAGYITEEYPLDFALQRMGTLKRDNNVSRVRMFERKTIDKQISEFQKISPNKLS